MSLFGVFFTQAEMERACKVSWFLRKVYLILTRNTFGGKLT